MENLPKRKSLRLKGFDYSSNGAYFITVCAKNRRCCLSEIVGADDLGSPKTHLTEFGKIVNENIAKMKSIYTEITVDKYVIMPNHIHLLLTVHNDISKSGAPGSSPPTNTVSKYITALKKFTNLQLKENIWQRGYYDHIIRNETDYNEIWQYIDENPLKWELDKYYTQGETKYVRH